MHVRVEGCADRPEGLSASPLVGLLEGSAQGAPDVGQKGHQILLGQGTRHIERTDVDSAPATLLQNPLDPVTVGEGKLPGCFRTPGREVRQKRCRGALGGRHERILGGASPGDAQELGPLSGRAAQVRKGLSRVLEEHDAETRDNLVEARRLERMDLGVSLDEAGRRSLALGPGLGGGDHRRGDVDAGRAAARSQSPRHGNGGAAGTAADVQDPTRDRAVPRESLDEEVLKGLEHLIERRLGIDPGASGRAIPQRRLIVIGLVHGIHARPLSLALELRWRHCATSSRLEVKRVGNLDIAQVARRSGIPASALRFYEERGLIASIGRRGQRRLFEPAVLDRLALIALGRQAGFSLSEIARMFAPDGRPSIDRRMLMAKTEELDRTIRKLTTMRDGLRHAAACPAPSHMECPTFRQYLRAAAAGAREGRRTKTARIRA